MKKRFLYLSFFLIGSSVTFSSCATMFTKKQTITVTSDVDGAQVYKGKKYVGVTPLTFKTKSTKNTFTLKKDGYLNQTINADVAVRWNTMWNYFNGFLGWFVDLGTGTTRKYTKTNYFISLKNPSINNNYNQIHQENFSVDANEVMGIVADAAIQATATVQQQKMEEQQQKLYDNQLKAQKDAEKQRKLNEARATMQRTKQPMTFNSNSVAQNQAKSHGNCDDLFTADPTWNQQIQLSLHTYGEAATRKAVAEYRAREQQESIKASKSNPTSMPAISQKEQIISAVTRTRSQIFIKMINRQIVAYSKSVDFLGKRAWTPIYPTGFSKCSYLGNQVDSELSKEFNCVANILNTQIYFNYEEPVSNLR